MKILVIPDVHLRTWMFDRASELLESGCADRAVCLMDIADDWGSLLRTEWYEAAYDAAIAFAKKYPETLWCYGNHDVCYPWGRFVPGYSAYAEELVCRKLEELRACLEDETQLAFVHRIDRVLFSHGGVVDKFVRKWISPEEKEIDQVVKHINSLGPEELWDNMSPLAYRPQYKGTMFRQQEFIQVIGHSPTPKIMRRGNLISCDVFSTNEDGTPIGTQEFLVIDTETGETENKK